LSRLTKGKRRHKRMKALIPIRVCVKDEAGKSSNHMAYTLDTSAGGARLGGIRCALNPGTTIEIQRSHQRAKFRVMWTSQMNDSTEIQVGVESLEPDKNIWLVSQPDELDTYMEPD
jgi:hypothetical protein